MGGAPNGPISPGRPVRLEPIRVLACRRVTSWNHSQHCLNTSSRSPSLTLNHTDFVPSLSPWSRISLGKRTTNLCPRASLTSSICDGGHGIGSSGNGLVNSSPTLTDSSSGLVRAYIGYLGYVIPNSSVDLLRTSPSPMVLKASLVKVPKSGVLRPNSGVT